MCKTCAIKEILKKNLQTHREKMQAENLANLVEDGKSFVDYMKSKQEENPSKER